MRRRWIIRAGIAATVLGALGVFLISDRVVAELMRPKPSEIPQRDQIGAFPVEGVSFAARDGVTLSGWLLRSEGTRAVVLLHGLAANRLQHVRKMELYAELGFGVLSYDARCHGASDCARITGGLEERLDLEAAVDYLRAQGYEEIGLDGFSMGAATITFADQQHVNPAFVVLESCYQDMPTLIQNAVGRIGLPGMLASPVLWRMGRLLGEPINVISPFGKLSAISAPTLMLLGDSEFQVSEEQARRMFDAIPAAVKHMYVFKDTDHEVFCLTRPEDYEAQLLNFLQVAGIETARDLPEDSAAAPS